MVNEGTLYEMLVKPERVTALEVATEVEGHGKKLTIERRDPDPKTPIRAEPQARAHAFTEAEGFLDYVGRYGTDGGVVIYADVNHRTVYAVLNEQDGQEVVHYSPQHHPLWEPWLQMLHRGKVSVSELLSFLRQNRRQVVAPDGRDLILMLSQVTMSKEVTVWRGSGRSAINGIRCVVNIQGEKREEKVELPESILVKCPIFIATEPRDVEIDLILEAHGDAIAVTLNSGDIERAEIDGFMASVETIKERVESPSPDAFSGAVFTYGRPKRTDWRYLK